MDLIDGSSYHLKTKADNDLTEHSGKGHLPPLLLTDQQAERLYRRLSPVQFKAALYAKGWKLKDLALYWDVSPEWLTRLAGNVNRPIYFDHAVRGLPRRGRPIPLPPSWLRALSEGRADALRRPRSKPKEPGFEYQDYLVVGTILVVSRYLGDDIDEGMRGIVVGLERGIEGEVYQVVFESGALERFAAKDVESYLAETGLERENLMGYKFLGPDRVKADFERGLFEF